MDLPPSESNDPLSLLLRSLLAALRTAESWSRPALETDPAALWRQWLAIVSGPWGSAGSGAPLNDLWARWLGAPEATTDLIGAWSRWYAANGDALAAALDQVLRTPEFVRASARALDDYATAVATQRRAAELAARNLPFATHADVARLAQLIIDVEAKVERLLDQEQPEAEHRDRPVAEVSAIAARLDRLEAKVDRLVAALAGEAAAEPAARRRVRAKAGGTNSTTRGAPARDPGPRRAAAESSPRQVRLVRSNKMR
jgi:hypothetical protein